MNTEELTDKFQKSKVKTLIDIVGMASAYSCMVIGTIFVLGQYYPGCIAGYIVGVPAYYSYGNKLRKK